MCSDVITCVCAEAQRRILEERSFNASGKALSCNRRASGLEFYTLIVHHLYTNAISALLFMRLTCCFYLRTSAIS